VLCHLFVKSSILLQYVRICVLQIEKRFCYASLVLVVVTNMFWSLTTLLICIPMESTWNPKVKGMCLNKAALLYSSSAILIFCDFLVLIIPMVLLRHSLLPLYKKLALAMVLGLGGL
jgi:hypothetical protein